MGDSEHEPTSPSDAGGGDAAEAVPDDLYNTKRCGGCDTVFSKGTRTCNLCETPLMSIGDVRFNLKLALGMQFQQFAVSSKCRFDKCELNDTIHYDVVNNQGMAFSSMIDSSMSILSLF